MRRQVEPGKLAAYFPQERPIPGSKIRVWAEHGGYLGIGTAIETRNKGVAIMVNGKTFDSDYIIHWVGAKDDQL